MATPSTITALKSTIAGRGTQQLARLITTMHAFVESNGRILLESSLVHAGNELSLPYLYRGA